MSPPDGKLLFGLIINKNGSLNWSLNFNDQPIILNSVLGLSGWSKGLTLNGVTSAKKDTVWKPVYGERNLIRDHYQEFIFSFLRSPNPRDNIKLIIRAYNEGIAFRYSFSEDKLVSCQLLNVV